MVVTGNPSTVRVGEKWRKWVVLLWRFARFRTVRDFRPVAGDDRVRGMSSDMTGSTPLSETDLGALVAAWIDWAGAAEQLGASVNQVRTMIREHQLAAAVPAAGAGQQIPAEFIHDGEIVKGLPGLLTLLHDWGYTDRECIAWIFAPNDYPGRAIDALRENRGSEVKRRAQALGI